jgi:prevent-host-death family protein
MALRMSSVSVSKARQDMKDLVNRVAYGKKRIYLTSHDKKMVALVPVEDIERLQALEDAEDIREAELALKEIEKKGSISLAEMKKRLG